MAVRRCMVALIALAALSLRADPKVETKDALPAFLRHLAAVGAAWGPAPSPDGTRVGFITTLFGSRQAALLPTQGGYPSQLTDEPGGVLALRWAPTDPRTIFVVAMRGGQRRILATDDSGAPAVDIDPAPGDQLFGGFTRDGKRLLYAVRDGASVALKVYALESKGVAELSPPLPQAGPLPRPAGAPPAPTPAPLSESLAGIAALSPPAPDGRTALVQLRRGADETIAAVDLSTTRVEVLTPHEGTARFRGARFSPDGRLVYVLTDAGRAALGVDVVTVADKKRKALFAPGNEVEAYALSEDGHRLVAATVSGGETLFVLLELPSLRQQPLPQPPPGALQAGDPAIVWSRGGDRIYFAWGQPEDTVDVFALRIGYGSAQRLTKSPRPHLPEGSLPRPRTLTYVSFDGRQVPALLWMPRPAGARPDNAPPPRVALFLGGGAARPVLDARIAALSAAGFAVLAPSPRGSEGRGKAHAAEDAAGAVHDVAFAARHLRSVGEVDAGSPLLVGAGAGAAQAVAAALRDPGGWSGLAVQVEGAPADFENVKLPRLALDPSARALGELAAFARERLSGPGASAAR